MKIFLLAIIIAVVCMVIKNYKPEYALLCQLCGVIIIFAYAFNSFKDVFYSLTDIFTLSGLDSSFLQILIKALGISVMTDFASTVCRDSGNNTLSNAIEFFGKTIIVFMALPILKKLTESAIGFIK